MKLRREAIRNGTALRLQIRQDQCPKTQARLAMMEARRDHKAVATMPSWPGELAQEPAPQISAQDARSPSFKASGLCMTSKSKAATRQTASRIANKPLTERRDELESQIKHLHGLQDCCLELFEHRLQYKTESALLCDFKGRRM